MAAIPKTGRPRVQVSQRPTEVNFPHNALNDLGEKAKVFAVQGFGRFGPFGPSESDSTVRFRSPPRLGSDRLVALGRCSAWSSRSGWVDSNSAPARRRRRVALALWAAVTWVVVTLYLPMAWDRYLLPTQSVNALLAALAISSIYDRLVDRSSRRGRGLRMRGFRRRSGVFVILLASYAFFWHSRDWNSASRLMLTYAIVDRGTVTITGLDGQTGDKALFQGQYYSDKLPGYPCWRPCPTLRQAGVRAARPSAESARPSVTGRPTTGSPWGRRAS